MRAVTWADYYDALGQLVRRAARTAPPESQADFRALLDDIEEAGRLGLTPGEFERRRDVLVPS